MATLRVLSLLLLGAAMSAAAQQAQTTAPQTAAPVATQPAPAAVSNQRLSELFYQLQILQQEVQELRGLVVHTVADGELVFHDGEATR